MDFMCRTCMCHLAEHPLTNSTRYHIFETINLVDILIKCSSLAIDPSDKYSAWICKKCYEKVLDFWEFQEMCRRSISRFNEMLNEIEDETECVSAMDALSSAETAEIFVGEDTTINPLEMKMANTDIETKHSGRMRKTCASEFNVSTSQQNNAKIVAKQEKSEATSNKMMSNRKVKKKLPLEDLDCDAKEAENNLANDESSSFSDSDEGSSIKSSICQLRLKCNTCPKQFIDQHRLEAHQRKHEGLPPYPCTHEGCNSSFSRWHYYQAHLKQHTVSNELVYKCEINQCERVYKNKSALNIHKRKHHNCGPELKKHMCEICGKVFKSSAVLNDHRFTHVEKSLLPHICEEEGCTKRFSNKEKLKIHKMRHAGIKNFICPHCGMRKTTRNELKIHINYHTLERTWPCRFCAKVCNSAGNLKMHVRNIHERAKDFACRYCDRTFAKADTRKYHEMTHTGEKPHACDECGRRFLQPAALRTHRKIHSKDNAKTVKITTALVNTSAENMDLLSADEENVKELATKKSNQSL